MRKVNGCREVSPPVCVCGAAYLVICFSPADTVWKKHELVLTQHRQGSSQIRISYLKPILE